MNSRSVLVIAPHPDDETLGCGGTILKYRSQGIIVNWLIVTKMTSDFYKKELVEKRQKEIEKINSLYGFSNLYQLSFKPAQVDQVPKYELVSEISEIISSVEPSDVFTAYRNDIHSDHLHVFDAVMAACKTFRAPFVKRLLAYETLSETEFDTKPGINSFKPNVFEDISDFIETKKKALSIYESEVEAFPFPRSLEGVEALARFRGLQSNCMGAEAFLLIKEIK